MIRFDIITLFPGAIGSYLNSSMLLAAQKKRLIAIHIHDLRRWGIGPHKKVDDRPYGGGPGMVFKIEPVLRALKNLKFEVKNKKFKIILFSPVGKKFNAKTAAQYAKTCGRIVILADHYEGFDARLPKIIKDVFGAFPDIVSIGDYVLTGGEIPSLVITDAVTRHVPGVLGKRESLEEARYGIGMPTYTRPENFICQKKSYRVPRALLSGNHQKIDVWRKKQTNY